MSLFLSNKAAMPAEPGCRQSHLLLRQALSQRHGRKPHEWRFARSGSGQLLIEDAGDAPLPCFSISATDGLVAVALSNTGAVGVDVETLARVSLNASPCDDWLSPDERRAIGNMAGALLVTELACRWTLKEALGKAAGTGLALPLPSLTISISHMGPVAIASSPIAAPAASRSLKLFGVGDLIVGLAFDPVGGATLAAGSPSVHQ